MLRTLMSMIFPLITFPYTSRILNPEGIGKINFANSIISYFTLLAGLGIGNYALREASKLRDDRNKLSHFSQEIILFNFITTIIAYVLLFIAIIIIPKFYPYRLLLIVISSTILFSFLGIEWLYTAKEDFFYITIRSTIFQIISIILMFILIKKPEDYIKYAAISVFANVGSNICNFIHSRKYIDFKVKSTLLLKRHIKPILLLFSLILTSSIYNILDTTMVGLLSNDYHVGLYAAATKINKIVISLVVSMGSVLLPRLSYLIGNKDTESFNKLINSYLDGVLLLAFPCCIGLTILAEPIIVLLSGNKFIEAIPAMRVMNPLIIILSISNCLGVQLFFPLGKEKWTLYSDICGAVVNFTLNLILIPRINSLGAAIGTICAEASVTIVQIIFARKLININIIFTKILKYLLLSVLMGIPVFICSYFISNILLKLIISIVVGIISYFIILLITKNIFLLNLLNTIKTKLIGKKQ